MALNSLLICAESAVKKLLTHSLKIKIIYVKCILTIFDFTSSQEVTICIVLLSSNYWL